MSKSRPRRASRRSLYLILALSLVLAITYVALRPYFAPQPTQIMVITPIALQYGQTTSVSGVIQKDAPIGKPGSYILVLPDMRTIMLDVQGLDSLIGQPVSITGTLSPAPDSTSPMTMTVTQITVN